MTTTLAAKKRQQLEDQMQAAVVQHIQLRHAPGLVFWHTPNSSKMGGKRTSSGVPLAAMRLKKLGLLPGVSDLVFIRLGVFYALELKVAPNKPTEAQWDFINAVNNAGGHACWTDDFDRALAILETWDLIRSQAVVSKMAG
jgi:hypothetical protein